MVDKLCIRMRKSVNLWHVYAAMTADIATGYCFPEKYGLLDKLDCGPDLHKMYASTLAKRVHAQAVPFFPTAYASVAAKGRYLSFPEFSTHIPMEAKMDAADKWHKNRNGCLQSQHFSDAPWLRSTWIWQVRVSSYGGCRDYIEGRNHNDHRALALATYYILSDQQVLKTLTGELAYAIPESTRPLPLVELEKLEYLTATIMETLRISLGVLHRLQRISPEQTLHFWDKIIPPDTPVSMSTIHVHNNTDLFPEPYVFKPERWLPLETERRRLQKYLVAFDRGSRSCLGIKLGYAELYMTLAGVFRNLGGSMKIVDIVKEKDVDICRDILIAGMRAGSTGIKALISESGSWSVHLTLLMGIWGIWDVQEMDVT